MSNSRSLPFFGCRINYVAPDTLQVPDSTFEGLRNKGVEQSKYAHLTDEVLEETDVLYMTRIQKERFTDVNEYLKLKGTFVLTPSVLEKCKSTATVMHPLPRVDEITPECDDDKRSIYFTGQIENGLYVRMAILYHYIAGVKFN